jgi:hypothetical protein
VHTQDARHGFVDGIDRAVDDTMFPSSVYWVKMLKANHSFP